MEVKNKKYIMVIYFIPVLILCISFSTLNLNKINTSDNTGNWEEQLNSLNHLVMRTSSINLTHGLALSQEQVQELIPLALQVDQLNLDFPDGIEYYSHDLKGICNTYKILSGVLLEDKPISDSLKNTVYRARELHSDIIKRSLLAAHMPGYQAEGCLKCHAAPELFPKGSISGKNTPPISAEDRKEIDLAHVKGLFGEEGTLLLWNLRDQVYKILTSEQKYVFGSFRCCLIPQEDVANPGIYGQSFVTNEWIAYFRKIREVNDNDWQNYKSLFFIPLGDILESKLPGIRKKDKTKLLDDQ